MRIRNNKLQLWLSEAEADRLDKYARSSKMSKSAYLRNLINGYEPQAAPTIEYHRIIRELRAIGSNINQIAHRAHCTDDIRAEMYDSDYVKVVALADELTRAFLPAKRRK